MSSPIRRMEIRGMKRRGFARTPYRIVKGVDGVERPQRVSRGGLILDPNGDRVGYHWPRAVSV